MKNWVVFPIEAPWSKFSSVPDTTVFVSCPLTAMYCCSNARPRLGEGVARRITQRVLSGWVPDTTFCSPRRLTSVHCRSHNLHKKKYACFQPFVFIYFISLITYKTLEIHEPLPNSLGVLVFNGNIICWKNLSSRVYKMEKLFPTSTQYFFWVLFLNFLMSISWSPLPLTHCLSSYFGPAGLYFLQIPLLICRPIPMYFLIS